MALSPTEIVEKFWAKVEIREGGCWVWTDSVGKSGGKFYDGTKQRLAHCVAYELLVGPIPDGRRLRSTCRNVGCVRPDHRMPATQAEVVRNGNVARGVRSGQGKKTYCFRGHPFNEANTYLNNGRRHCRECLALKKERWLDAHPTKPAEYQKAWRARNPELAKALNDAWRAKHADRVLARTYAWRRANPDIVARSSAASMRKRRAAKKGVAATLTDADWQEILRSFGNRCAYCGVAGKRLEQEHLFPLSRGGTHTPDNVVPACRTCNARKYTKSAAEFVA